MERPPTTMLRIGAWCVHPASGQISRAGETARVEVRTMRLLMCLAERAGEVVSIEDLLTQVWSEVIVSPDSVYQAVASLRRLLGDDPKQPTYIETVPRLGYRMVARVTPWAEPSSEQPTPSIALAASDAPMPGQRARAGLTSATWATGAALGLALVIAFLWYGKSANNNPSASAA